MKEKKFLELLNLYLDGEIEPADAARLEREILADPARRRIYNDYCRIHRATKLVYEQFRAAGAAQTADALPPASRINDPAAQTAAFDVSLLGGRTGGRAAPRPFRRFAFFGGLAAACIAGVFLGSLALTPDTPDAPGAAPAVAVVESQPAAEVAVVAAPATNEPAAFTAPFAAEVRADPFVHVTSSSSGTDPFALTPWTPIDRLARDTVPSLANTPPLRVDPRFQPVGYETRSETTATDTRENNPFRLRVKAQPVNATP